MKKKITASPLNLVFAMAAAFAAQNPELVEMMNSPEEQERMDQMFKDLAKENDEPQKLEE